MNRYILLIVIICIYGQLGAQSKEVKRAEASFASGNFPKALDEYNLLLENEQDPTTRATYRFQIGEIYRRIGRADRAERWFNDAIKGGYMSGNAYLALGEVQLKLGKYDEAKSSFESYKLANPSDPLADIRIASCEFAKENQVTISLFDLKRIENVCSRKNEFGVSYFNESLLFSTTRPLTDPNAKGKEKEEVDEEPEPIDRFDDRVIPGKKKSDKSYTKSGLVNSKIMLAVGNNGRFNRPVQVVELNKMKDFADDGVLIYDPYSRQSYYTRRDGKKTFIHTLILKNNKWEKAEKIEVKSKGEPIGHPFITKEGNRIYFTSTMPGGMGKSDIWYINKTGTNTWSEPINAGDKVNTPGNEVYPHIGGDYFFFSSDGKVGLGGLDIYAALIKDGVIMNSVNLGAPFNSSADDYNINIRTDGKEGVLISGRLPKNEDDIFHFVGFPSYVSATGKVIDASSNKPISNVALELFEEGRSLGKTMSDEQGNFLIPIAPKSSYVLKASVIGYNGAETKFSSGKELFGRLNKSTGVNLDFALTSNASVISGRLEDRRTAVPLENEVVSLIVNGKIVQTVKTDASGIYKFGNLQSNTKYIILADPKGYFQDTRNLSIGNANQKMEYSKRTGYDLNLSLEKYDLNKEVIMKNVVFQNEKVTILSESYKELDRLAEMFKQNPHTTILITSYVDLRTPARIANELSTRRIREIRDYLVNVKKVSPTQITIRGAGKARPIENNPKTDEEHERNSRVTYAVTKAETPIGFTLRPDTETGSSSGSTTTKPVTSGSSKPAVTEGPKPDPTPVSSGNSTGNSTVDPADLPFRVQIAGLRALDLKRPHFVLIKTKLNYDIRYELGQDGLYRYYVGGFETRGQAQAAAEKIKGIGIDCIVKAK